VASPDDSNPFTPGICALFFFFRVFSGTVLRKNFLALSPSPFLAHLRKICIADSRLSSVKVVVEGFLFAKRSFKPSLFFPPPVCKESPLPFFSTRPVRPFFLHRTLFPLPSPAVAVDTLCFFLSVFAGGWRSFSAYRSLWFFFFLAQLFNFPLWFPLRLPPHLPPLPSFYLNTSFRALARVFPPPSDCSIPICLLGDLPFSPALVSTTSSSFFPAISPLTTS